MRFKEVVGQIELKEKLVQAVKNGRISHAQLFLGKAGYGSLPLALAYIQYINCQNKEDSDSCGVCSSCVKMEKLSHPDLHFAFPVNTNKQVKSKPISDNFLDSWREINRETPYFTIDDWLRKIDIEQKQGIINVQESQEIIKKLSFKPFEAAYKTLVVFGSEALNPQASNKLLKLIEEPTDKTIIILIAENEEQLIKTITSRTQIIRIPPIKEEFIQRYFVEGEAIDEQQSKAISLLAEGNMNTAKSRLEQGEEEALFFELFKMWMRSCYEANIGNMYNWVEEISARSFGREKQKRFIDYTLELIREGVIRNYSNNQLSRYEGEVDGFLQKFSPFIHGKNIGAISELLEEAYTQISRNIYAKVLFMDMSMKFANLLRIKPT